MGGTVGTVVGTATGAPPAAAPPVAGAPPVVGVVGCAVGVGGTVTTGTGLGGFGLVASSAAGFFGALVGSTRAGDAETGGSGVGKGRES